MKKPGFYSICLICLISLTLSSCSAPVVSITTSATPTIAQSNTQTQLTTKNTTAPTPVPTTVAPTPTATTAPAPSPTTVPTPKPTLKPSTPKPTLKPAQTTQPTKTQKPITDDNSLKGFVIGIDPGHQSKGNSAQEPVAPGASETKKKVSSGTQGKWTRVPEYVVVLDVGLKLKEMLEAKGATVIMSRETHNVDVSNARRATMMNERNAGIVLRIHCNGNNNEKVYGACMLIPSGSNNKAIHEESRIAGKVILDSFIKATGAKDNGLVKRADLTGFNWSEVPVCLIEMGYMSNKNEDELLTSKAYQEKCIEGLFNGITNYLLENN